MEQVSITSSGSPYATVTVAVRGTDPAGLGTNRTTQTLNGFAGGVIQSIDESGAVSSRVLNVGTSQPSDVSIATDAGTNRAQGTIMVRNFDGSTAAGSPTAVFELGSTTGTRNADSAFIDDNVYAMTDRKGDSARSSHVQSGGTVVPINSNTVMASYQAAPLQGGKLPGGVTPCECAFLSWGWWSGDISYDNPGYRQGQRDRLNLATYVAGTLTNVVQLPNTGTATYNGHAIGSVINGNSQYVAAGTFTNVWSFQTQRGQVTIGNFDGATYQRNGGAHRRHRAVYRPALGSRPHRFGQRRLHEQPVQSGRGPGRQLQHQWLGLSRGWDVRRPEVNRRFARLLGAGAENTASEFPKGTTCCRGVHVSGRDPASFRVGPPGRSDVDKT